MDIDDGNDVDLDIAVDTMDDGVNAENCEQEEDDVFVLPEGQSVDCARNMDL